MSNRHDRGFTLVELMVVMVIIGVVIAGAILSFGGKGSDSDLQKETDRLKALIEYVQERAALQTVEYGLRCEQGGFRFVMYDSRAALWVEDPLDDQLRARPLLEGITLALNVEDRDVVLPKSTPATRETSKASAKATKTLKSADLTPQIMLFSSGDMTSFKLTLARPTAGRSARITGSANGKVTASAIVEKPP